MQIPAVKTRPDSSRRRPASRLRASPRARAKGADPAGATTFHVGIFLVPEFPLLAFAALIEPLRAANRLSRRPLYSWRLYSRDGGPVASSSGVVVAAEESIASDGRPDLLIVCAGLNAERFADKAVFAWLRRLSRAGRQLGAQSTGAFVLARAGLLDGRTCTLHWESAPSLVEQFPAVKVTNDIFVEDGNRLTCSGGTAALDMMLHLIARHHGRELAKGVSEQFIHPHIRTHDDKQRMDVGARYGVSHPKLTRLLACMERTVGRPLELGRLAQDAGLSPRQVERLFARYLQTTPRRHYMALRLARARSLVLQTGAPTLEIAVACGFTSAPHFSRSYKRLHGRSPREDRRFAGSA